MRTFLGDLSSFYYLSKSSLLSVLSSCVQPDVRLINNVRGGYEFREKVFLLA